MSNIKRVTDDEEFKGQIQYAGNDLVVVDFYTNWCGPCKRMEPLIQSLAMKYPHILFLKVDADQCFETAMQHDVRGVPQFVLYRNMRILDSLQGAQPRELESKIQTQEIEYKKVQSSSQPMSINANAAAHSSTRNAHEFQNAQGHRETRALPDVGIVVDVSSYLDLSACRCINDLSPSSFEQFLSGKKLISGKGSGKLLLVYSFKEKLILHSFAIKGRAEAGPKVLRFFVNHPKILDFNVVAQLAPSQEVTLCANDLKGERRIEFRAGSFTFVSNLQIFIMDSMSPRVELDSLQLFGAPILPKGEEGLISPKEEEEAEVGIKQLSKSFTSLNPTGSNSTGGFSRELLQVIEIGDEDDDKSAACSRNAVPEDSQHNCLISESGLGRYTEDQFCGSLSKYAGPPVFVPAPTKHPATAGATTSSRSPYSMNQYSRAVAAIDKFYVAATKNPELIREQGRQGKKITYVVGQEESRNRSLVGSSQRELDRRHTSAGRNSKRIISSRGPREGVGSNPEGFRKTSAKSVKKGRSSSSSSSKR